MVWPTLGSRTAEEQNRTVGNNKSTKARVRVTMDRAVCYKPTACSKSCMHSALNILLVDLSATDSTLR